MNQFIPGRSLITNDPFGDVILNKLALWRDALDNLTLNDVR
jgi:hypothetical protein